MTDEQFDLFLEQSIKKYGENYINEEELDYTPHEFSPAFEKKMAKLIKKQKSFYYPMIKTPLRYSVTIAITILVILSTMVMSISALRSAFIGFITEMFDDHTDIQMVQNDNAPTSFEDIYAITKIPDGFELTYKTENADWEPCLVSDYYSEYNYLIFEQHLKSTYNVAVNTEGYEMIPIKINAYDGFVVNMNNCYYIVWDSGNYVFTITSDLSKIALIEVAESVQKVE